MKDTPVLALKTIKIGVGVYFGTSFYGYALNCHFVYLTTLWTKFVCFIYMRPQKVKFTSVQINLKQVSYYTQIFYLT